MLKKRLILFIFWSLYYQGNSSKIADLNTNLANVFNSVTRQADNIHRAPTKGNTIRNVKDVSTFIQNVKTLLDVTTLRDFIGLIDEISKKVYQIANKTSVFGDERNLNASQLIRSYGFPAEEHTVTTEDGYILRLFRIPSNGSAVLILHGVLNSADNWLCVGENSLPYQLASQGYDVWLGNSRGNRYSRNNTLIPPEDPAFFDFSWHEMGIYDNPATIDYILDTTSSSKLSYIAHSQGTTVIYVTLSELPDYNDKINVVISLAPISFISNGKSPLLQDATTFRKELDAAFKVLGYEFFPYRPPATTLTAICASSKLLSVICVSGMFLAYGFDYDQIDYDFIQAQLTFIPAGCSFKQILHFLQNSFSGGFNKFDHGVIGNLKQYGSPTPPAYAVEKITSKNMIFFGKNDWLADPKDVERLENKLPNAESYQVMFDDYNHMDFLWARDTNLVYPKVIDVLRTYTYLVE